MRHQDIRLMTWTGQNGYGEVRETVLAPGPQIAGFKFFTTNIDAAQLTVDLLLNGDPIVPSMTGTEINAMRTFLGLSVQANVISLDFIDRLAKTEAGMFAGLFRTQPGDNILLRVTTGAVTAAQTAAGSVPSFTAEMRTYPAALDDAGNFAPRDRLMRFRRAGIPTGQIGENQWDQYKGGPRWRRAWFMTGAIEHLEIWRDKVRKVYKTAAVNASDNIDDERTPDTANMFVFDPVGNKFSFADLFMTENREGFRVDLHTTAAGVTNTIIEEFEFSGAPIKFL